MGTSGRALRLWCRQPKKHVDEVADSHITELRRAEPGSSVPPRQTALRHPPICVAGEEGGVWGWPYPPVEEAPSACQLLKARAKPARMAKQLTMTMVRGTRNSQVHWGKGRGEKGNTETGRGEKQGRGREGG